MGAVSRRRSVRCQRCRFVIQRCSTHRLVPRQTIMTRHGPLTHMGCLLGRTRQRWDHAVDGRSHLLRHLSRCQLGPAGCGRVGCRRRFAVRRLAAHLATIRCTTWRPCAFPGLVAPAEAEPRSGVIVSLPGSRLVKSPCACAGGKVVGAGMRCPTSGEKIDDEPLPPERNARVSPKEC
jgi:hypothetical protein